MQRNSFIDGSEIRAQYKKNMVKDYEVIIAFIDAIPEQRQHNEGWMKVEESAVNMFIEFTIKYPTTVDSIGAFHKGISQIRKNLVDDYGRKQLVRVMRQQMEKFNESIRA